MFTILLLLLFTTNAIDAQNSKQNFCQSSNGIQTFKNCNGIYLCFKGKPFYWRCPTKYLFDRTTKICSFYEVRGAQIPGCV